MSDNRAHLEEKYTWDLTTIFATDADWETEYESTVQDLKKASAYAGHLLDSAKNLLEATELYMSLMRRLEKIYVYASMKNDQDTTVGLYQEYQAKASNLYSQLSEAFAYFEPEFMALDDKKLAEFKEQEPGLDFMTTISNAFWQTRTTFFLKKLRSSWQQQVISSTVQRIPSMSWIMLISSSHGYQMVKGMWLS